MTVEVNGVPQGDVLVVLRGSDVLVPPEALRKAGVKVDGARIEIVDGKEYVALASMADKLGYTVDLKALSVTITADTSILDATIVNLSPATPRELVIGEEASGFLNYSLRGVDLRELHTYFEAGFSVGGVLLYSGLTESSVNGWIPIRGLSNVAIDQRSALRRWTVGDAFVSSGVLGGGAFLGGLTIAKSFDLDPYFIQSPMLSYSGAVLTPSVLDVYVNDQLVRRESLAPGPFHVEGLLPTVGQGSARYVVRDAFGRQSDVSSSYYLPGGALAAGIQDYEYSIGFPRNKVGLASFDYRTKPAAFARHRVGLTDWLTGGLRLEAELDLISGGASLSVRTPIGELAAAGASSTEPGGFGYAGLFSYGYMSRAFGAGLRVAAVSDHYATVAMRAAQDRPSVEGDANVSVPIGPRVSVSARYAIRELRDAGLVQQVTAYTNVSLNDYLSLVVTGAIARENTGAFPFEVFATLNFATGPVTGGAAVRGDGDKAEYSGLVQMPVPQYEGFGFRAQGAGSRVAGSAAIEAQYQALFGRYLASYDYIGQQHRGLIELSGGFAAMRRAGVFATKPIQGGFAVIQVPGVENVRGYLNNNEVGRTDEGGNLIVPNILPYYGNRIGVGVQDLPMEYTITVSDRLLAPSVRGGVRAEFQVNRANFFRGRVVIPRGGGIELVPTYGELTLSLDGRMVRSPVGSRGQFELSDLPPGSHPVGVVSARGRCRGTIAIPKSRAPVVDLGDFRCEPVAPGAEDSP